MKTLLERAKGSALDIVFDQRVPVDTMMALLSPHARQIKYLELTDRSWADISKFSGIGFEQLPLLHTLKIIPTEWYSSRDNIFGPIATGPMVPPPSPFFINAINLKQFTFHSKRFQFLGPLAFPHLTIFELSARPMFKSGALGILNFLKASPMLRAVKMKVDGAAKAKSIPRETVVLLPNVETFSLHMVDALDVYDIAVHISCPKSRNTSLTYELCDYEVLPGLEVFPTPDSANAIANQYARSPVEEITFTMEPALDLGVESIYDPVIGFSLTFRLSDAGTIRFGLQVTGSDTSQISLGEIGSEAFSLASGCIRAHSLLSHTKRLHVKCEGFFWETEEILPVAKEVGRLFESVGPLDELAVEDYGLRTLLIPFFDLGELEQLIIFPSIRELIILHPSTAFEEEGCAEAIVGFAESQHAKGIPFERITVPAGALSQVIVEVLERYVGAVDFHDNRRTSEPWWSS